jgi:hypothetical protein
MRLFVPIVLLLIWHSSLYAQTVSIENFQKAYQVHITQSSGAIKVDGVLDDSTWSVAEKKTDFFMKYPSDVGTPANKTVVQLTYDDKFLYVAFTCYDSGKSIIQSLKRDIGHLDNDGVGIILDPQNSHTNGFFFALNAMNAQSEDQISLGQQDGLTWSWNNKWFSATKKYNDRWVAEIAIPFKSLRYPAGNNLWGINFIRVDMSHNQYSGWTHVPTNFRIYNMGYTGALIWDKPAPTPGKNMVMIPFITSNIEGDKENHTAAKAALSGGLDTQILWVENP